MLQQREDFKLAVVRPTVNAVIVEEQVVLRIWIERALVNEKASLPPRAEMWSSEVMCNRSKVRVNDNNISGWELPHYTEISLANARGTVFTWFTDLVEPSGNQQTNPVSEQVMGEGFLPSFEGSKKTMCFSPDYYRKNY